MYNLISSLLKLVSGFTQACKVNASCKFLCNVGTEIKPFPRIFIELPKFKVLPVGLAEIKTFFTGVPESKLTLPVITPVGFRYPMPLI